MVDAWDEQICPTCNGACIVPVQVIRVVDGESRTETQTKVCTDCGGSGVIDGATR